MCEKRVGVRRVDKGIDYVLLGAVHEKKKGHVYPGAAEVHM